MIQFSVKRPSGKHEQSVQKKDVITALNEPWAGPESPGKRFHALMRQLFTASLGLGVFFSSRELQKRRLSAVGRKTGLNSWELNRSDVNSKAAFWKTKAAEFPEAIHPYLPFSGVALFIASGWIKRLIAHGLCFLIQMWSSEVERTTPHFCTSGDVYRSCNGVLTERILWRTWSALLACKMWKML